ncbi:MAG: C4-dicarboxylate ABC transporter [Proteobacteria bacterium]|nr:MAG: C4-dicarboxylate ABC transporter [Pseudomonadota bacterium]
MKRLQRIDTPKNEERRRFFETSAKYGFTAAMVAGAAGALTSPEAAAQSAKEESERKAAADYTMTFATAYIVGVSRAYPVMQLDFKENVQNMTGGKVYVNLAPGKKLGAGGALAKKVQSGVIQVAQHSVSNFAPFAPEADLINMPYMCARNQEVVNLVTSDAWKTVVDPKINASGFKALWYTSTSARTFSVRQGMDPILTPDDLKGVKFRVPGSKMLQQFYRMLGANPTPVAWGETPSAIKQGVADALDPVLSGLYIFGFGDILSNVTLAQSVHGLQVYSCNLEWFDSLPGDVQEGIEFASDVTFRQNLAKVPAAFAYTRTEMERAGVKLHDLSEDQIAPFRELAGHQRPEWDEWKIELAGSIANFDKMLEASQTQGNYYVHNV